MDAEKIGKILTELRGDRTQDAVAEAIGVTKMALSHYENGRRIPKDEIKVRIATYYGKPVNEIFFN